MLSDNFHRRKEKTKYSIVFVPNGESAGTRTVSIGKTGIFFVLAGIVLLITVSVTAILVYTPVGIYLPVKNPEMERKYNKEIVGIQVRLNTLSEEMLVLREYNHRLRRALGEGSSDSSSVRLLAGRLDSASSARERNRSRDYGSAEAPARMTGDLTENTAGSSADRPGVRDSGADFFLSLPVGGYVSRSFEPDLNHFGIDFAGKTGSPVFASADGRVIFSDWTYDYGFMLMIAHAGGYVTVYKHNQTLLKNTGSVVRRGEPVALLGNTGNTSRGSHMHFELWYNGRAYDPNKFLLTVQ